MSRAQICVCGSHLCLLSPKEVANALSMSQRAIYRWISDGDLKMMQPSGKAKSQHRVLPFGLYFFEPSGFVTSQR
ncbi:helix-turn-helix domain-containing protein [Salinibacter ruber]|uniref:helix-turn-helix domain-containing protein n=1 Tax=Salinibacter ruber TaxID=146919 RepID=UPI00244FD1ED|nr:excisionase family DNA binding protein [Salinibacter ruber]